jgi:hypothetical protein
MWHSVSTNYVTTCTLRPTIGKDINIMHIIFYLLSYVHFITFTALNMNRPVTDFT